MGTNYAEFGAEFILLENVGGKTLARKTIKKEQGTEFLIFITVCKTYRPLPFLGGII
jgi:hypothetical protein